MPDMGLQPHHHGHPRIPEALDHTGHTVGVLQNAGIPNSVIAEVLLQEVAWMIEMMDDMTTAEAAAMRGVISWFSAQCTDLVGLPDRRRLDRH
jgi:hypothetical protein